MKYLKMLGLFALAVSTATVLAANASADEITSPLGTTATSIHATGEGHQVWDMPFGKFECNMTLAVVITSQSPGKHVTGKPHDTRLQRLHRWQNSCHENKRDLYT